MLQKYIGDKAFYRRIAVVALPIIIQNAITNFVSLLDNIMVGQVGTIPMSGVSIANHVAVDKDIHIVASFLQCLFNVPIESE